MKTLERIREIYRKHKDAIATLGDEAEQELTWVIQYALNTAEGQDKANRALMDAALNNDDETRPVV